MRFSDIQTKAIIKYIEDNFKSKYDSIYIDDNSGYRPSVIIEINKKLFRLPIESVFEFEEYFEKLKDRLHTEIFKDQD